MLEAFANESGRRLEFSGRTTAEPPTRFWYYVLYLTVLDFLNPKDGTPIDANLVRNILFLRIFLDVVPEDILRSSFAPDRLALVADINA